MIAKISTKNEALNINNDFVRLHIENLIDYFLNEYKEYCTDGSISPIGAIFFVDEIKDLEQYHVFGLFEPIIESSFEWFENIGNGYKKGCIIVSTDFAINIIASNNVFKKYLEGKK